MEECLPLNSSTLPSNFNKSIFNTKVFAKNTLYTNQYEFVQLRAEDYPALLTYQQKDLDKYYNTVYYLKKHTETIHQSIDQLIDYSQKVKLAIKRNYQ